MSVCWFLRQIAKEGLAPLLESGQVDDRGEKRG
jgi:hypothetical protein